MAGSKPIYFAVALAVLIIRPGAWEATSLNVAPDACVATLDPDTVLRGAPAVAVTYGLSEVIGPIEKVTTPEDSQLKVSGVDPTATMVTFDTQSTVVGAWDVTFHGSDQRTCTGTLNVKGMER